MKAIDTLPQKNASVGKVSPCLFAEEGLDSLIALSSCVAPRLRAQLLAHILKVTRNLYNSPIG
jgi:hypothetical protein